MQRVKHWLPENGVGSNRKTQVKGENFELEDGQVLNIQYGR